MLVLAQTNQEIHPYEGCSVFIVPADAPGIELVQNIPHLGSELVGKGHAEIKYNNVRVPEEHLFGTEGEGFTHVQERLGPARLTHCMRFSGMAERSLDIATAYLSEREGFGSALAENQDPRHRIAEHYTRIAAARSLIRTAANRATAGQKARIEVSMAKVFTANVTQHAIDDALQFCGANGMTKNLPIADFYETIRQFRIVDGADEVHKRTIARAAFDEPDLDELEPVVMYDG